MKCENALKILVLTFSLSKKIIWSRKKMLKHFLNDCRNRNTNHKIEEISMESKGKNSWEIIDYFIILSQ